MGQPRVQRSSEGLFTRLGRALDAAGKSDTPHKTAPAKADAAEAKPLPKKYAATSGRVVRGPLANYVTKALKLADDMRALAAKEDAWYNRTTPKDVDKVINKYKPLIDATSVQFKREAVAYEMIVELYNTPTANNLFWKLSSNSLYKCWTYFKESTVHEWSCGCKKSRDKTKTGCESGEVKLCSIGGVNKERDDRTCYTSSSFFDCSCPFDD